MSYVEKLVNQFVKTDWKKHILEYDFNEKNLSEFLENQMETFDGTDRAILPPEPLVFNAFNFFDFQDLKVVIIGQDPYHKKGQAMGLSFSVPDDVKVPPSLKNIFKELGNDLSIDVSNRTGNLISWAGQGVLLLNSALTVLESKPNKYQKEWNPFTNWMIKYISDNHDNLIFILWGNDAKAKTEFIDEKKHYILEGGHPSPLNRKGNFLGEKYFSKTNQLLVKHHRQPINW